MAKERALTSYVQGNKSRGYRSGDLYAPGLLAKWPVIGIMMVLLGGLLFGAFVYNLKTDGPLLQWDVQLSNTVHTIAVNSPNRILEMMLFGFFIGKEFIQVIAVILCLYFIYKRFWRELAMVVIGLGGGAGIWYFLTRFFDRPRPPTQFGFVVTDPSFPSGHTISAVLCYGLLAYLLVPKMPSRFWKWFVVIAMLLVMLFIGFSRFFIGGHYPTDLLAGYALGIAWAGLVYTLLEKYF